MVLVIFGDFFGIYGNEVHDEWMNRNVNYNLSTVPQQVKLVRENQCIAELKALRLLPFEPQCKIVNSIFNFFSATYELENIFNFKLMDLLESWTPAKFSELEKWYTNGLKKVKTTTSNFT
jgi:hypothetical protein